MLLDVVIVTFDSDPELLKGCIASIRLEGDASECKIRVVVVDNGSPKPPSVGGSDVVLLVNDENIGFGRAVNRAVGQSRADYILLLNPDAELTAGSLKPLLDAAREFPTALLAGCLVQDGAIQSGSYVDWTFTIERVWRRRRWEKSNLPLRLESINPVEIACGGALLAARPIMAELGPFDDRFFLYGEDVDLSRRARKLGLSIFLVAGAAVQHVGAASQVSHGRVVEESRADAAIRLAAYHRPRLLSLLQRLELTVITIVGLVMPSTSSASRTIRSRRLAVLRDWGLRPDLERYRP